MSWEAGMARSVKGPGLVTSWRPRTVSVGVCSWPSDMHDVSPISYDCWTNKFVHPCFRTQQKTHWYICVARPNLNWVTPIKETKLYRTSPHATQYTLLQMFVCSVPATAHCGYTEMNDVKTPNRLQVYQCFHRKENNSEFQCAKLVLVFIALYFGATKYKWFHFMTK